MLPTVVVWLVLVLPHALGGAGLLRMDAFRREAFGHLRRTAAFMMLAVVAGLGYYTLVLVQADAAGWIDQMRHGPGTPMSAALYLQAFVASAAVGLFLAAGTEAWRVTAPHGAARPRGGPDER